MRPGLRAVGWIALLAALPLAPALLGLRVLGPFDQIRQMAPWNEPAPFHWDVLQADGALQFYAWRDLVFEAVRRGEGPFWNPYQLAGTPLLANSQSAALYPPHLAVGLLGLPTGLAMAWLAWLHIVWAGLGVAWLARRLGAEPAPATASGALFALSPFVLAWVVLPSVITTVAWIPWVLGCVLAVFESGKMRAMALLAACSAMMLLGGHLQFAAYGVLAALVFALVCAIGRKKPMAAGLVAMGLVMGGMLAAPQVFPALRFSQFSHRRAAPSAEGYQAFLGGAIAPFEWPGAIFPAPYGLPRSTFEVGEQVSAPAFWPMFVRPGANFAESALAIGPLVLFLLLLLRRKQWSSPALWGVGAVGVLGLLIALGSPLNAAMVFGLPGWSATGSPGRASVLFVLAACVAAGVAWPTDLREPRVKRAAWIALALAAASLVLPLLLAPNLGTWLPGARIDLAAAATSAERIAAPLCLLAVILGAAAIALFPKRAWLAAGLAGLAQLALVGPTIVPFSPRAFERTDEDPNLRRAFVNSDWSLFGPSQTVMFPNTAASERRRDIAGYDSLLHRDTVEMLRQIDRDNDPAPPANGNILLVKPGFDARVLAEAGVTEVWSLRPIDGLQEIEKPAENVFAYKIPGPGRAFVKDQGQTRPAKFVRDGFDRTILEAQGPGSLVLNDRNMPGWSVTIDGEPATIAGGTMRRVELSPGSHRVEFRYEPPGLKTGLAAAGLAAFLCIALAAIPARKSAKTSEENS